MALPSGTILGPYEIQAPLGAGGMGEVYRARDTRLERNVAIKILPAQFSSDAARKQRFEREAKAISSLNHPHICVLYDIGHQEGIDYLVMECLEGETLAKRLERGALPLEQVVKIGTQIADALEKAHRSGIVHRDLKPGNIMLTPGGAKLLDFGLAKPVAAPTSGLTVTALTQASPVTAEGTVIGTFQYMSPEQIEGKELDGRSDIFSLGAVLYETLTGKRAFDGKSSLSVASAILEKEPALIVSIIPLTPPALEHTIQRCLAKDADERWQTARDLALELKWATERSAQSRAVPSEPTIAQSSRERFLLVALAATALIAVALGFLYARRDTPERYVTRSYIRPNTNAGFIQSGAPGFALSPDGRRLAYVAAVTGGNSMLWLRSLDSLTAQPLEGTGGASYPFWSPDNRYIGFFAVGKLKRIEASGGPPFEIADAPDGRGGTWNAQGDIIFTPSVNSPLYRISASGGSPSQITTLKLENTETSHRWPFFLPDGRNFLFLAGSPFTPTENPTNAIMVGSLDSKETKVLVHSHAGAVYASGKLVFLRQSSLMAQPLDLKRLTVTGDATRVGHQVREDLSVSRGLFSASETGLLTYLESTEGGDRQLMWLDRSGKPAGTPLDAGSYVAPRVSPDGKRVAFYQVAAGFQILTYDIARALKTPLTFATNGASQTFYPVWSPDGKWIAYTTYNNGKYGIARKASNGSGTEEVLLEPSFGIKFLTAWSPDGKLIAYQEGSLAGWKLRILPIDRQQQPYTFLNSAYSEREAAFSSDGKWVAYCANDTGDYRMYVVPFGGGGGRWQVSAEGGCYTPRWRRDAKEMFYYRSDNRMMSVDVSQEGTTFHVGASRVLFETRAYGIFSRYDVTPDGQRFLIPYEAGEPSAAITLVTNWTSELKE